MLPLLLLCISKNLYSYNTYDGITFSPTNPVATNKVFTLKNTITESFNGLDGTSTRSTNNVFDVYNNVKKNTTDIKLGSVVQKTVVNEMTYHDAPTATTDYHIGRLNNKKTTATLGSSVMKSEEQYTYGTGTKADLITQTVKFVNNNSAISITETNSYDAYGNVIQKTIAGTDGTSRASSFEYDDTPANKYGGRFMTKSTDVDLLSTNYAYNSNNGMLIKQTSPQSTTANPIFTNISYDVWGKKTLVQDYLGTAITNRVVYMYENNLNTQGNYIIIRAKNNTCEAIKTFYDYLDRPFASRYVNINGTWVEQSAIYDDLGRVKKVSEPYFSITSSPVIPNNALWNQTVYDSYGRVSTNIDAAGKTTTIAYTPLTTTVNDAIKTVVTTKNATGTIATVTDPGGTINYNYYANDKLQQSKTGANRVSIIQDDWGRKTTLTDTSAGIYKYTYNLLGETLSEETPNGKTNYEISPSTGKLIGKKIMGNLTESVSSYNYNPTTKLLTSIDFKDNIAGYVTAYSYTYDSYKPPTFTIEKRPTALFEHNITYDSFSRPQYEFYSARDYTTSKVSDKWITHTYLNGFHWQILNGNSVTGAMLWQTESVNERGQLLIGAYGNAIGTQTHQYDQYGFLKNTVFKANGNTFLNLNTSFDTQKGNLDTRFYTSSNINISEKFSYDNLSRLTNMKDINTGVTKFQEYDNNGSIYANDLGTYNYNSQPRANATPPFMNSSITLDENNQDAQEYYITYSNQKITYNAFKKPVSINNSGLEKIDFQYNDFGQRSTSYYGNTQPNMMNRLFRKSYSADGSMEITTNNPSGSASSTFITYIGGDAYTAPLILKSDGTTQNYFYLHRDYQGSILAITNPAGTVIEKRFFDAWGQLEQYTDGAGNTAPVGGHMFIDRGYTGHEHILPMFGGAGNAFGYALINMNGRLYDPKIHRFLMPDRDIQDPYNTQNYNRYGYVLNNPLMYSDPTGENSCCGGDSPNGDSPGFPDGNNHGVDLKPLLRDIGKGWDALKIKDWSNRNLNIKNMSNAVSDGLKSTGDFISRNLESFANDIANLFGGGSHQNTPPPPVIYTFQLNGPLPNITGNSTANFMSGNGQFGQYSNGLNTLLNNIQTQQQNSFEDGLRNVLKSAKIGQQLSSRDLVKIYGVPKNAANLIDNFTKTSATSINIDWSNGFSLMAAKAASDAVFKDGSLNIEFLQNGSLRLSGNAIGIDYNGRVYYNLLLEGNYAKIPNEKRYRWKIGF